MAAHDGPARSTKSHRSTLSLQKTEIAIHVYDLLGPSRFSSVLWTFGTSLLHSGVVINGREYAYGGHNRRGLTGVFWTKPRTEPPGAVFRCELLHGFTLATSDEIDAVLCSVSSEFLGTSYNLLTRNCNHFTSYLCEKLTGNPGPGWLNRAASIGVTFPCFVPRDWIVPPGYEAGDGDAFDEDDVEEEFDHDDDDDNVALEHSQMLRQTQQQQRPLCMAFGRGDDTGGGGGGRMNGDDDAVRDPGDHGHSSLEEARRGKRAVVDSQGRKLPPAERAPIT